MADPKQPDPKPSPKAIPTDPKQPSDRSTPAASRQAKAEAKGHSPDAAKFFALRDRITAGMSQADVDNLKADFDAACECFNRHPDDPTPAQPQP